MAVVAIPGYFRVAIVVDSMRRRDALRLVGSGSLLVTAGCLGGGPERQSGSGATVGDAKLVLEKYRDTGVAIDDGYRNTRTCVDGLGVPFVNPEFTTSYDEPRVLLYERTGADDYELLGVEWLVPADSVEGPPEVFAGDDRRRLQGPMDGHFPSQPRHYGLHGWLFPDNPEGRFARFNPTVRCSD